MEMSFKIHTFLADVSRMIDDSWLVFTLLLNLG